ncbi:hypothetical protein ESZ53_07795 [Salinibacterium sp. UTAS2018]|uniref:hypothetical protein n=1 Tax=Salinibacterium sp. UTAS2018 TaxID=2508880 RepID=UPI0010097D7C|nr:hypothetical protein [Salinibacterium sp. UTAS2018]QAV70353.1 hypothetical protein ESZ53_07795 [Salinibacterium sp. UTAS2018]
MADPMPENTSDGAATAGGAATPDAAAAAAAAAAETPKKSTITPMRIALWVLVAGAGLFMVLTGLVGVLVKAQ